MQNASYVIGIIVYDKMDLLDMATPAELFDWMRIVEQESGTSTLRREIKLISADGPSVRTANGVRIGGDLPPLEDAGPIDLLWVPGGDPARLCQLMIDTRLTRFLRAASEKAQYTVSVCEGALLLAAAGLLDGYRATTHWAFRACLRQFPQIQVEDGYPRYVIDRDRITGGGISSGLDEALKIISLLAGDEVARKVQLNVQYNPDPPFNDGDPSVSGPPILPPGAADSCADPQITTTIRYILANQAAR
jgi:cyclohexyl-isocyanide hydratase